MLTQYLGIGGLERMILSLCRKLASVQSCEPFVFAYDQDEASNYVNLISDFKKGNIPVESYKKPAGFSIRVITKLRRLVKLNKIDIVHSHNLGSLIYASFVKLFSSGRVKLVHTQHSFIHLGDRKRYRVYEKLFTRFVDELTVVSCDTKQTYIELGFPGEKIHVISNGIEFPSEPIINRSQKVAARQELLKALNNDGPAGAGPPNVEDIWILYMARLHPQKGQVGALHVWRSLDPSLRQRASLIFVGPEAEPGQVANIQVESAKSADGDRVFIMGSTNEPIRWAQCADVYLSCSEFEGMPLGPLEAVGCGVPCVLSDIPGHKFLAAFAELFDREQPDLAARLIEGAISRSERDGAREMARLWDQAGPLIEQFSQDEMGKRYAEVYKLALQERAVQPNHGKISGAPIF